MISQAFDYAAETISDTFNLDEKQEKLVRLVLIVAAGYIALKFVRSVMTRKD